MPCPKQGEDDDENARPLAESLLLAIADLLFCPDFTVQSHRRSTVVRGPQPPTPLAEAGSGPLGPVEGPLGRGCSGRAGLPGTHGPREGVVAGIAGREPAVWRALPPASGRLGKTTHCLRLGGGWGCGAWTQEAWAFHFLRVRGLDLEYSLPPTATHHQGHLIPLCCLPTALPNQTEAK